MLHNELNCSVIRASDHKWFSANSANSEAALWASCWTTTSNNQTVHMNKRRVSVHSLPHVTSWEHRGWMERSNHGNHDPYWARKMHVVQVLHSQHPTCVNARYPALPETSACIALWDTYGGLMSSIIGWIHVNHLRHNFRHSDIGPAHIIRQTEATPPLGSQNQTFT